MTKLFMKGIAVALLISANTLAFADELVALVKLKQITLFPRDYGSEFKSLPVDKNGKKNLEGSQVLSNACGTQVREYEVKESFIGAPMTKSIKIEDVLGELCKPEGMTSHPAIVKVSFDKAGSGTIVGEIDLEYDIGSQDYYAYTDDIAKAGKSIFTDKVRKLILLKSVSSPNGADKIIYLKEIRDAAKKSDI